MGHAGRVPARMNGCVRGLPYIIVSRPGLPDPDEVVDNRRVSCARIESANENHHRTARNVPLYGGPGCGDRGGPRGLRMRLADLAPGGARC